jgi:predicted transcriptional regulator
MEIRQLWTTRKGGKMMDKLSSENKFAIMPEWVIELDISHTAFRLYAVLARYADNVTHQAFPSLETLADRLGCGEKTVRRAIEDLVEHGAIKKHNRGRYQSSLYTVMTSPPEGSNMSHEGSNMSEEGSKMSTRLVKNVQVTRTTELEPKERELLNSKFDKFWAVYPKKTDKRLALKSFVKALKRETLELILDGAMRYRDDPNRDDSFTKNPSTWLNADAWENGPEPVRGRKLTNAENAALLAQKYRGQEQVKAIESPDVDFSGMLKGVQ